MFHYAAPFRATHEGAAAQAGRDRCERGAVVIIVVIINIPMVVVIMAVVFIVFVFLRPLL